MKKPARKWLTAAIVTGLLTMLAGGYYSYHSDRIAVDTFKVETRTLAPQVTASGTVQPGEETVVVARTAGFVRDVLVEEGQRVKSGQILVRLDSDDVRIKKESASAGLENQQISLDVARAVLAAKVRESQARLWLARERVNRLRTLAEAGAIPQQQLDEAEVELVAAEQAALALAEEQMTFDRFQETRLAQTAAEVRLMEYQLDKGVIRAERAGTVLQIGVKKGEAVQPGTVIAIVGDLSVAKVDVLVKESDIGAVVPGLRVTVSSPSVPGEEFAGAVKKVGLVARAPSEENPDPAIPVTVEIPAAAGRLRSGVTAEATIHLAAQQAPVVPLTAIVRIDGKPYVFVVDGDRVALRRIWLAVNDKEWAAIRKGVSPGETVVVSPPDDLTELSRIKVKKLDSSALSLSPAAKYLAVAGLAAAPWGEVVIAIPFGYGLGLSLPVVTGLAWLASLFPVAVICLFFRRWNLSQRFRPESPRAKRALALINKYGTPGLALLAPVTTGVYIASAICLMSGAPPARVFAWQALGLAGWAAVAGAATFFGFHLAERLF